MSDKALSKPQLAEYIHYYLHWCMVSYCKGTHVQDGAEFQGARAFCRQGWRVLGKAYPGASNNAFLLFSCIF